VSDSEPIAPADERPRGRFAGWRGELVLLALILLGAGLFTLGYLVGAHDDTFRTSWYTPLRGTKAAPEAVGSIQGGNPDEFGNTPLVLTVRGLAPLPAGETYSLYLTRSGQPIARSAVFTGGLGAIRVRSSTTLGRDAYTGWIIVHTGPIDGHAILLRSTRI
jgi:hypothetical protein